MELRKLTTRSATLLLKELELSKHTTLTAAQETTNILILRVERKSAYLVSLHLKKTNLGPFGTPKLSKILLPIWEWKWELPFFRELDRDRDFRKSLAPCLFRRRRPSKWTATTVFLYPLN
jgi:hypothetical protein